MKRALVWDNSGRFAEWVAARIPHMRTGTFGPCVTIGVAGKQPGSDPRLLGAVVFHDYRPQYRSVEWSAAADDPRWLSPKLIGQIMRYPFDQLNVRRITAVIPRRNERSRDFHARFGFKQEGSIRRGFGSDDAIVYGLMRADWARSPFNLSRERAAASSVEVEVRAS